MINEYFDLITKEDLNLTESYNQAILSCDCGKLYGTKACRGRTIFPWFGHHPEDGNCRVVTNRGLAAVERKKCTCEGSMKRVSCPAVLRVLVLTTPIEPWMENVD